MSPAKIINQPKIKHAKRAIPCLIDCQIYGGHKALNLELFEHLLLSSNNLLKGIFDAMFAVFKLFMDRQY